PSPRISLTPSSRHLLTYSPLFSPFFFTYPAPTVIYTLSLHDALPIFSCRNLSLLHHPAQKQSLFVSGSRRYHPGCRDRQRRMVADRKSTRLNSSHVAISYAVFCLKKKKKKKI